MDPMWMIVVGFVLGFVGLSVWDRLRHSSQSDVKVSEQTLTELRKERRL